MSELESLDTSGSALRSPASESASSRGIDLQVRLAPSPGPSTEAERIDGAGEPCPAPLVWQEIRERYVHDSTQWEIVSGDHRIQGRTWGEGPPLYFVNHFAGTAELFSLTLWLLKDDFRCVVFDSQFKGPNAVCRTKPRIDDFASDLFAVAEDQGDLKFSVYGAGFGAAVALQAALARPELIDRLVLQHGFAKRRLSFFERILASLCLRSSQTLNELPQRRRFQAVNHQPWFPPFDSSRFEFLVESTGKLPLKELARRALAVHAFDIQTKLPEIVVPVLLLRTEGEGRIAAESQEILSENLKNCRTEWMHSAGQHPCLTHPHRVAKLIKSHCAWAVPENS